MPAGLTYDSLATTTLSTATSSVTFSGISGSYTDLVVVSLYLKPTGGSPRFRFNSDSSTIYSQTVLRGNGTTPALSDRETGADAYFLFDFFQPSLVQPNVSVLNVMNYANTTTFKNIMERAGSSDKGTYSGVGLYRSTNAITSITINADGGSGVFSTGSIFSLYGVKAA